MKTLLKKLSLTSLFCHYKYHLTSEMILEETQYEKPNIKLVSACYLDRNLFWSTSRLYENINLLELRNIIQAEKVQLPPMEGDFFWRIDELHTKRVKVTYFVVPSKVMSAVPNECKFIIPLCEQVNNPDEAPLTIYHKSQVIEDERFMTLNWLEIYGFFIKRKGFQRKEKLSNRKLAISTILLLVTTSITLSLYSVLAINYYQNAKIENEPSVNSVLAKRQKYTKNTKLFSDFITFLDENPNVLLKLSQLEIDPSGIFIERIRLITNGVQISGTTKNSATLLLEQIIKSKPVKEAKFSRAVTKNHHNAEVFFIEVSW